MTNRATYKDGLYRLGQIGNPIGIQLVRLIELDQDNLYNAKPIEFDDNGQTCIAEDTTITVTNLAEPADSDGIVPVNTDGVAIDVEGRWVVFLRPAQTSSFPGKVISSQGSAKYILRQQVFDANGNFIDEQGTDDFTARNLAELSLGPGAAVDNSTIVLVAPLLDRLSQSGFRYVFDHPAYAKYLD